MSSAEKELLGYLETNFCDSNCRWREKKRKQEKKEEEIRKELIYGY